MCWLGEVASEQLTPSLAIARPGRAAVIFFSLVIGSRKSVSDAERNVLLLSRPCCRAYSNREQNGLGVPSLDNGVFQIPPLGILS